MLDLSLIRIDGGTQSRVSINETAVSEYCESIRHSIELPPVIIFFDGVEYWLADGFHRYHAHRAAGAIDINSEIREGTKRDAILYSVGANSSHGLRRTNEDKRRAVMTLLNDQEWSAWSDNAIAKACGVTHPFVGGLRAPILKPLQDRIEPTKRIVERNGKEYKQNTANIGKKQNDYSSVKNAPIVAQCGDDEIINLREIAGEYPVVLKENEAMQRQIASLQTGDTESELVRMNRNYDALNGRLQGEISAHNEAKKQAQYFSDILAKIRKFLGVEKNSQIMAALKK